jgi:hypothetical protein
MSDKEKKELLYFLKEMILKYPNDQELGKQIRKYYFTKDKKKHMMTSFVDMDGLTGKYGTMSNDDLLKEYREEE